MICGDCWNNLDDEDSSALAWLLLAHIRKLAALSAGHAQGGLGCRIPSDPARSRFVRGFCMLITAWA